MIDRPTDTHVKRDLIHVKRDHFMSKETYNLSNEPYSPAIAASTAETACSRSASSAAKSQVHNAKCSEQKVAQACRGSMRNARRHVAAASYTCPSLAKMEVT